MFIQNNKRKDAFTLAEVLIAKRESGKMSSLNISQTRELKAPSRKLFKQCAFTLAEVLITLGIIGVVAAMTIPTLIASYQKSQYVTQLKKAYTQFNQVLIQISADNNCTGDLVCTGLFGTGTTSLTLGNEIKKYYKVAVDCQTAGTECGTSINYSYNGSSGSSWDLNTNGEYKFITQDGILIDIANIGNNCSNSNSTGELGNMSQYCGDVYFDINGLKKPNNFGRDFFQFYITNGKGPQIYPRGGKDDGYRAQWGSGGCTTTNSWGCAGRIIEENWTMNY